MDLNPEVPADLGQAAKRRLKSGDKHVRRTMVTVCSAESRPTRRTIPSRIPRVVTTRQDPTETAARLHQLQPRARREARKHVRGILAKETAGAKPMIEEHFNSNDRVGSQLVKINFPLPPEDQAQGEEAENLWAEPLGGNRFRIDNVPFHVYGISSEDVVVANELEGRLRFQEVATRGG